MGVRAPRRYHSAKQSQRDKSGPCSLAIPTLNPQQVPSYGLPPVLRMRRSFLQAQESIACCTERQASDSISPLLLCPGDQEGDHMSPGNRKQQGKTSHRMGSPRAQPFLPHRSGCSDLVKQQLSL